MVNIGLRSKRYNCSINLCEKVTFVVGNSGSGKTEFVRRLLSKSSSKVIEVTEGYSYEVLTLDRFEDYCNGALKHILSDNKINIEQFNLLSNDEKKSHYIKYWSNNIDFPFSNSIIIIDDEDFINSLEFNAFFDSDKSNYYMIINRSHLSHIGYSVDEVYEFKCDGVNHFIEKKYNIDNVIKRGNYDYVLVEGIGSDFIFFSNMIGKKVINPMYNKKLNSGGRSNVVKAIELNKDEFKGKSILVLIDYVAFGSNFESLYSICNCIYADFMIYSSYKSFEYLLLKSNIINDKDLDKFVEENRLKFKSLEVLYTERLRNLTSNKLYSYSKKNDKFPVCYYKDCCENKNNRGICDKRKLYHNKNKFSCLLDGTDFEDFLNL